jgi:predicted ribosomally synthesized peptide with SipW-like signal peptide
MSVSRPLGLAIAGAAVAGLALIGVGANATFTDSTTSSQSITAGTLAVSLSSPDVSGCQSAGDHCASLNLPAVGPESSTFLTSNHVITVTNTGNIPAVFSSIQMTESHDGNSAASNALVHQMDVCIQSTDASGGPWTEGNGPLATAVALNPTVTENPVTLQPGDTATYVANFYAGRDSLCNPVSSDGSITRAAWDGYDGGSYHTPASLTNAAEGGVVTPTLSFNFTG